MLFGLLAFAGCSSGGSGFTIVDHRDAGPPQRYREVFHEAYYDIGAAGNVDIVLRRREPDRMDPTQELTQVIHLRSVWRSIPGRTVAERTQINATVTYSITSGRIGAIFEGVGSLFVEEDARRGVITGKLELALLDPKRRLAMAGDFFKRAELSGEFRAVRNERLTIRIVNDMNRRFGPGHSSGGP